MPDHPERRTRKIKPGPAGRRKRSTPAKAEDLRLIFNRDILPKVGTGEVMERVENDNHPAAPLANEPFCTRSQLLLYHDRNGKKLAEAHRYLRKDGKIGASGLPDPKEVRVGETIYLLEAD